MSLQEAIPEGDSEEGPLKPTDRQAINHNTKKLQDLKEKSEKLKSSIQKENAQTGNTNNQTDQTETRKLRIYNISSYTESWNFEDVRCVHYSKYHLSEK